MGKNIFQVKLVRSRISQPKTQRMTLKGLGLTKMHRTVKLNDTPAIRGMVRKVSHLVEIVEE